MRTILYGSIRTMDPAFPLADSVLIQDGKISKVGFRGEPGLDPEPGDTVLDLHGKVVLPGLIDAHLHFTQMVWEDSLLDLSGVATVKDLRDLVEEGIETGEIGEWLVGRKLKSTLLERIRSQTGSILGRVGRERPVILGTEDMHSALLNLKGVELLESADLFRRLPGGLVERMDDLSLLKEDVSSAAWRWIEAREKDVGGEALDAGVRILHSRGVTGIYTFEGPAGCLAIAENNACATGLMTTVGFYAEEQEEVLSGLGAGMTRGGLKIFLDGALGSRTALLLEPYEDEPTCGMETTSYERRKKLAVSASGRGIDICVHAVGDKAVRLALDLLVETSEECEREEQRDRIEHIQLLHPDDLPRLGESGVIASVQPVHLVTDRKMAETAWGDRCMRAYPMRSLYEAGARVVFGSDAPFSPVDPLTAVKVAVTRSGSCEERADRMWRDGEGISVEDAFSSHTTEAAYAARVEERTGMIREGLRADMVVLSGDPFHSEDDLVKTEIAATIAGGEVVYGRENLLSARDRIVRRKGCQ